MKTPLAWLNLAHYKVRTLAAVAGVTFSVVLIFMQLGFLGSVETTASLLFDALRFDLMIRSPDYLHMAAPGAFPRDRLYQAASMPGVQAASPLCLGVSHWRNPCSGQKRRILTMGMWPEDHVFEVEEIQQKAARELVAPEFALVDRQSRHEFGPRSGKRFGDDDIGVDAEVGSQRVRIVGHFCLGGGFAADGAILLNERGFHRIYPGSSPDEVSLGLLKLQDGADAEAVAARLGKDLPKDVEVLTRCEVLQRERERWVNETSVGIIFRLGVAVALVVGTAIVYQVLSSDVANHLTEYATLKAIGYSSGFVAGVVLRQAVALAILGFALGLVLSEALYRLTAQMANIPIAMTPERIVSVLALAVAMCTVSGLGAVRKLRSADPADLF